MKRFTRLATVALAALTLVGGVTSPAHATTKAEVAFTGTLEVTGGIGYPLVTLGTTTPGTSCLTLPGDPVPQCHPVYDHQRTVSLTANISCRDEVTNTNKAGKPAATTGACSISAGGTITGHCGLSGGQLSGNYVDSSTNSYDFNVHFTEVAGKLTADGHITKRNSGRTGLLKITGLAIPEASLPGGPSCTNKTQERFIVSGNATGTIVTA